MADTLATPPYVRISRMIRDISAEDILVGNKKANLRQMVEGEIARLGLAGDVRDIRFREIAHSSLDLDNLYIHDYGYRTATTHEHFLEWVTPKGCIAGFLRLSSVNKIDEAHVKEAKKKNSKIILAWYPFQNLLPTKSKWMQSAILS